MSGQNPKPNTTIPTTGLDVSTRFSSNAMRPRRRMAHNYLLVWVDENINPENEDYQNTVAQLRSVVNEVNLSTTPAQCIQFLKDMDDKKAFIISSGTLGQHLVPEIHRMTQVDAIYIFCGNKVRHKAWVRQWSKIRGVFTSIQPICESLEEITYQCDHDSIPMSFVPKQLAAATTSGHENLNRLPPTFMYSVLFKEIILEINDDDEKSMQDLMAYCRQQNISESELNEFQCEYQQRSPIWIYTCELFFYSMMNKALRSLDVEGMAKMGFFIRHLHRQLEELHEQQTNEHKEIRTVYRGQGLSREDFQNLLDSKGGLLSFNNFLSTSIEQQQAMNFVQPALKKSQDVVGVIFIMTVDPNTVSASKTPFALIDKYSAIPQEKEILFSMHTVFRIEEIKQHVKINHLWEVQLTLTDDNDPQLTGLMNRMREDLYGSTGWHRLGDLMILLDHSNQAEEFYNGLLNKSTSDSDTAYFYHQLCRVQWQQGHYEKAISYSEKSLEIKRRTLPEDNPSLAHTYNNIASVYEDMGNYPKALESYEKSNTILEKGRSPNHPDLATCYSNIGVMYCNMNDYPKGLEYQEKALKIREIALPSNHPELAYSYNNIGMIYDEMGDYSKALSFLEKALAINRKSLLPTHPAMKTMMSNIDYVKMKM